MILLDTNALIWLEQGHRRTRRLQEAGPLSISPASLLELQFLAEVGRIRMTAGGLDALAHDDRWLLDDPLASTWFLEAADVSWTRDPFDRLIVAHARVRGWRIATADAAMLSRLGTRQRLEL